MQKGYQSYYQLLKCHILQLDSVYRPISCHFHDTIKLEMIRLWLFRQIYKISPIARSLPISLYAFVLLSCTQVVPSRKSKTNKIHLQILTFVIECVVAKTVLRALDLLFEGQKYETLISQKRCELAKKKGARDGLLEIFIFAIE